MFDRFTPDARRTVVLAQERAKAAGDDHIGPAHVIAAAAECDRHAQLILVKCGADPAALAPPYAAIVGSGAHLLFTAEAKKGLELALRESLQLKHVGISGAHILLGALAVGDAGPAREYLASCSITLADLRTALAATPEVESPDRNVPADVRKVGIETLAGFVATEDDAVTRDQIALTLIEQQIAGLQLREALATATALAGATSRAEWVHHLVAISEVSGDVAAVVRHGQDVLTLSDDLQPGIRGSLARAYAQRGESAEAWGELRQVPTGTEGLAEILTIEAAESYLLLGETERAAQTLAVVSKPESPLAIAWHMLVRAQIARADAGPGLSRSEIESVLTSPDPSMLFWVEARVRVEALHAELATGTPRKVAKEAKALAAEARDLGLGGVLCDALEVQAMAVARQSRRRSTKLVDAAINEAERLGRLKQVHRLKSLA